MVSAHITKCLEKRCTFSLKADDKEITKKTFSKFLFDLSRGESSISLDLKWTKKKGVNCCKECEVLSAILSKPLKHPRTKSLFHFCVPFS